MKPSASIETVSVVGGGISAWSAAAALKRRIPALKVQLIGAPVSPAALADRMISTLPSIHGFHQDLTLTDEDTIVRAESGQRLGSLFEHWTGELPPFVHAYGPYGAPVGGVPFHQLWLRERTRLELQPFDRFSPAAEAARLRIAPRPGDGFETGLQLTLERYGAMMRAFALHTGVIETAPFSEAQAPIGGKRIERVHLVDGSDARSDLYIDCTGPDALLMSSLTSEFVDWSKWLLCDRIVIGQGPPVPEAVIMDRIGATPFGWRWLASAPHQSSCGLAYSSAHADDVDLDQAIASLGSGEKHQTISLRQGRRPLFWVGNCVALGDAAVTVEPLEWTNLHLVHSQIDRLVTMMPGPDCAAVELQEYNRQCAAEADRVRDFLCLHYLLARRSEPFWKDAASLRPPDSLAHTMTQFARRARLPFYEEETFSRDSWLAVLLGQGFEPHRTDPLADQVSPTQAEAAFQSMRHSIERSRPIASGPALDLNPRGVR